MEDFWCLNLSDWHTKAQAETLLKDIGIRGAKTLKSESLLSAQFWILSRAAYFISTTKSEYLRDAKYPRFPLQQQTLADHFDLVIQLNELQSPAFGAGVAPHPPNLKRSDRAIPSLLHLLHWKMWAPSQFLEPVLWVPCQLQSCWTSEVVPPASAGRSSGKSHRFH